MKPTLQQITQWAKEAGTIIKDGYGKRHQITHKGINDLVTEVDKNAEDLLIGKILGAFPDHMLVTEESGLHQGDKANRWFIDPLDGTMNYAHGVPFFCVSIGFMADGELELGVVYDPMRDECFAAERGKGAFLNEEKIQVSTTERLEDSLLVSGFPHREGRELEYVIKQFSHFMGTSHGVRRMGSAALNLAYIASGRFDGEWGRSLNSWDVAGGGLLVREAGGIITNIEGDPDFLTDPITILAANPILYAKLLDQVRKLEGQTD